MSEFQTRVLRLLAENRSPDSYLAGASVIHQPTSSPRYSQDLDYFHALDAAVATSAESDARVLREHGYTLEWVLRIPTFARAVISSGHDILKIEWAYDTAFSVQSASALIALLPPEELGCLFVDTAGTTVTPDPASPEFGSLVRHYGRVGGTWPTVAECA